MRSITTFDLHSMHIGSMASKAKPSIFTVTLAH